MFKCSRTACKKETAEGIRIWNNPGGDPRDYCHKCANGILSYNSMPYSPVKEIMTYNDILLYTVAEWDGCYNEEVSELAELIKKAVNQEQEFKDKLFRLKYGESIYKKECRENHGRVI